MKIKKIIINIALACILNSTINTNPITSLKSDQNLVNSVCKIINDIIKSKPHTQDVFVENLGNRSRWLTINKILRCISDETAVVVSNLKTKMITKHLKKAAVIILEFDDIKPSLISRLIKILKVPTIFDHMANIICITSSSSEHNQRMKVLEVFLKFSHLNVAIVYESSPGNIIYEIIKSLPNTARHLTNPKKSATVFPDKLKNVNGFHYKVPFYYQPPVVEIINNKVYSPLMYFLAAVGAAQNAEFDLLFLANSSHFASYWQNRKMHFSINTAVRIEYDSPKVQTFDKKSYCALVPNPPNASYFSVIFVKPFDVLIWLLFILSIISSVVVWRMFRGRGAVDSHWKLAVGIFTMFFGQGAEFSRHNRFVLAFLLNIICLSVFLLSNLYEGVITSIMIEPAHQNRLKTVEDLLNSNYQISSAELFKHTIRGSSLIQKISSRLEPSVKLMGTENGRNMIEQKYIFIRPCNAIRNLLSAKFNNRFMSDYYYLLSEELSWQFVQLEASYFNPFVDRFQYFMDLCFQAGLPHMWKIMAYKDDKKFMNTQIRDEREILELQDLVSVFGILLIGLGLSTLVLLVEIFTHDCIKNINCQNNMTSVWNCIKSMFQKCLPKRNIQVRRIEVRPSQQF